MNVLGLEISGNDSVGINRLLKRGLAIVRCAFKDASLQTELFAAQMVKLSRH